MAQEIMVAGAIYEDVPSVRLPDSNGVFHPFIDTSDTTAVAADVAEGKLFHLADGALATGTASGGGGGGGESADPKDVNFIDYDGTIVYSYTKDEFLALTAMPENPTHAGLVSQGWNWSLADAQEYVADYGIHTIGQMYATESGDTEIDIVLREGRLSPYLSLAPNGTVTIDWGDGSNDTVTGTSATTPINTRHDYAAAGAYTIKVHVESGELGLAGSTSTGGLVNGNTNTSSPYLLAALRLRIAGSVNISSYAAYRNMGLQSVTIPNSSNSENATAPFLGTDIESITFPTSIKDIGLECLRSCASLQRFSLSKDAEIDIRFAYECKRLLSACITGGSNNTIPTFAFYSCESLSQVVIPNGIVSLDRACFISCPHIENIEIPDSVSRIETQAFQNNTRLTSVNLSGVSRINASTLANSMALTKLTIPETVSSIDASAFYNCTALAEIHFKRATPPTIANSNAFGGLPTDCIIYVPQGSLSAYTSASNYPSASTYTYAEE